MEPASSTATLAIGTGLSANVDPRLAAEQVCEQALGMLRGADGARAATVDLAVVFVSGGHIQDFELVADTIRETLQPGTLIGVSAEGIVGDGVELERQTGVSLFAGALPGVSLHPFTYRDLPHVKDEDPEALAQTAAAMGARRDLRATLFFADPFSVPAASAIEAMVNSRRTVEGLKRAPILGGMASGSTKPGGNVLILDDKVMRSGGVGVSLRGDVDVDAVVSQGCRPIGRPLVVTGAQRNVIRTLGGARAVDVLRDIVTGLEPEDRELLPNGVYMGRVINEYKARFGRGDFLIRGVLGVDQKSGAIAVGDVVRTGQTIQFHLRDAKTASEDLALLLAAQQLQHPPVGGLLFTCNGRGVKLFGEPHHDARLVTRKLARDDGTPMPLAGFFAAGEIGPIGDRSFLHGHTASLALFRPRRRTHGD